MIRPISAYFVNSRGRPGVVLVIAAVNLTVCTIASLLLIPPLGATGAALGSSVGYGMGALLGVVLMRRDSRRGHTAAGGMKERSS